MDIDSALSESLFAAILSAKIPKIFKNFSHHDKNTKMAWQNSPDQGAM